MSHSLLSVTGTADQLDGVHSLENAVISDHGITVEDDERVTVTVFAYSPDVVPALEALGLEVFVIMTAEQVTEQLRELAESQGDASSSVTGAVLLAFAPPTGEALPDGFVLTLTPASAGAPTFTFAAADAEDAGDGLVGFRVDAPPPGVAYRAEARVDAGAPPLVMFERLVLHDLLIEAATPSFTAGLPSIDDPIAFGVDAAPEPDADSELPAPVEDQRVAEYERGGGEITV